MTNSFYLTLLIFILSFHAIGQNTPNEYFYEQEMQNKIEYQEQLSRLAPDTTIDIKFYHLDIEIAVDSPYINGSVSGMFMPKISNLTEFILDFDSAFTIEEIVGNVSSYYSQNNKIHITTDQAYSPDDEVNYTISYKGVPQMPGGYKGLRYETHGDNEPVIATLSTPFLAHSWWPCNDGPMDKADSVFVDITIKDTVINEIPLMAVSNGILESTELNNGKKTFRWRHRYPIVPYYVMAAISNYVEFTEMYTGVEGESFPLSYYVFENHLNDAQQGVEQLPEVMDFFSSIFGPYPFASEKYGMTQLGFYGGIENQTNTIINNMGIGWFDVSVHELAHMWFADMITCYDWHHGWINEGFATYAEALWLEYNNGMDAYFYEMNSTKYFNGGTVYLEDDSNPFQIFVSIIYNKGSWVLHMLRGIVGDDVFFQIIKEYATSGQFMYKSAATEDFQELCEDISGQDLDYFFLQWIYDEYYPQYRYNYQQNNTTGQIGITIEQTQSGQGWRPFFTMPVQLHIEYTDNSSDIITVFNDKQLQTWYFDSEKELAYVEFDPQEWILRTTHYDPALPVNVNKSELTDLKLYPNPFKDYLWIDWPAEHNSKLRYTLVDLAGREISKGLIDINDNCVNINQLHQGVYLITIQNQDGQIIQRKVIKQ